MPWNYESEAFAAVHVKMEGLYHAEAIDTRMLREFDKACLAPATPWHAEEIKAIREAHDAS
jgi:putative transcriptional regulator